MNKELSVNQERIKREKELEEIKGIWNRILKIREEKRIKKLEIDEYIQIYGENKNDLKYKDLQKGLKEIIKRCQKVNEEFYTFCRKKFKEGSDIEEIEGMLNFVEIDFKKETGLVGELNKIKKEMIEKKKQGQIAGLKNIVVIADIVGIDKVVKIGDQSGVNQTQGKKEVFVEKKTEMSKEELEWLSGEEADKFIEDSKKPKEFKEENVESKDKLQEKEEFKKREINEKDFYEVEIFKKKEGKDAVAKIDGAIVFIKVPEGFWVNPEGKPWQCFISNLEKKDSKKEMKKFFYTADLMPFGEKTEKEKKITDEDINDKIKTGIEMMKEKDGYDGKTLMSDEKYFEKAEGNLFKYLLESRDFFPQIKGVDIYNSEIRELITGKIEEKDFLARIQERKKAGKEGKEEKENLIPSETHQQEITRLEKEIKNLKIRIVGAAGVEGGDEAIRFLNISLLEKQQELEELKNPSKTDQPKRELIKEEVAQRMQRLAVEMEEAWQRTEEKVKYILQEKGYQGDKLKEELERIKKSVIERELKKFDEENLPIQ